MTNYIEGGIPHGEGSEKTKKLFHVSQKTTYQELISSPPPSFRTVASDMVMNAYEIEPRIPFNDEHFLDENFYTELGSRGLASISNGVAKSVKTAAIAMEWDLHSPAVVYMSISYPYNVFSERQKLLEGLTSDIHTNITQFGNEESRERRLQNLMGKITTLAGYSSMLKEARQVYAQDNLPMLTGYTDILEALILPTQSRLGQKKNSILRNLQIGNIERALKIIEDTKLHTA